MADRIGQPAGSRTVIRRQLGALVFALLLAACNRPAPPAQAAAPRAAGADSARTPAPSVAPTADVAPDALVLPGPLAADATPDSLRRYFGAGNVRIGDVPGAEGETFHGVILFPDDPTRRAYLYFQDESALRGLSLVRVFDAESRWKLDDGIAIGTTLAELVRRNGKPITYSGLGWDYGGVVQDFGGGTLEPHKGQVMRSWRLGPKDDTADAANAYPIGEDSYRSDDPRYPRQGDVVVVNELSVSFPGEDDL
jgi:hypothetical protein